MFETGTMTSTRREPLQEKGVLLMAGEEGACHSLSESLEMFREFSVQRVASAREGITKVYEDFFDLVLIHKSVADIDAHSVCRILRRNGVRIPLIVLDPDGGDTDVILGLEYGASDYVTGRTHLGVLLARIRAHLRQFDQSEDARFQCGPFVFRPGDKVLVHKTTNESVHLTPKETRILLLLCRYQGLSVRRGELLEKIWGFRSDVPTHTLESHIHRLRQKIETDPSSPSVILSVEGGYQLTLGQ